MRGIDTSPIVARTLPKSMQATKCFNVALTVDPILSLIHLMATEICDRAWLLPSGCLVVWLRERFGLL